MFFSSASKRNLNFYLSAWVIIQFYWHYCQSFLYFSEEVFYLIFFQKQALGAGGIISLRRVSRLEGGDFEAHEFCFASANYDVPAKKGATPLFQGLYLMARQFDSGLEGFENFIVEAGAFVFCERRHVSIVFPSGQKRKWHAFQARAKKMKLL